MDNKIGIIANDLKLKNSIMDVFADEVNNGDILIELLNAENGNDVGRRLESSGAKAIIARGGGYRSTVGKVNVPVIHLKITTIDILMALRKADRYGKDIILFLSDFYYFEYDEWKDIIKSNVIVETIYAREGIEANVDKYSEKKEQVIIVGEWIPCRYARTLGMDYVGIEATRESIIECVGYAKEIINSLYDQKYKNEILNSILDGVHDAVVAIDPACKIRLFNKRAHEILKTKMTDVWGKMLVDVCPELSFMLDILVDKNNKYNEIISLKKATVAGNTSLLIVDGNIEGAICSFMDITKLQSIEKKIRFELNKKGLTAKYNFSDIISYDPLMKDTLAKAIRIGQTDSTVIIYGESGTGKEMIAQSIHNISRRTDEPFVAINCAALSESLLESELFGYEEGSFTGAIKGGKPGLFEIAHGGSIFLDEINSISLNLQAKLLRVLEEKQVMRIGSDYVIPLNVRVIAAANEGLKDKVAAGNFRKDLFYRLNILEVHIPPLRERKRDIIPLFNFYLKELNQEEEKLKINEDTEKKLLSYEWPGNVRELKNIVQRYILFDEIDLAENEIIDKSKSADLKIWDEVFIKSKENTGDLKKMSRLMEERAIEMLMSKGMKKSEIAKQLGISRTALWKKTK